MLEQFDLPKLKHQLSKEYFDKENYVKLSSCGISWNNRFRGATAGVARFGTKNGIEYKNIEISSKYISAFPDQLKTIMLHEMIHIIFDANEKHGLNFKSEMNRINNQLECEGHPYRISVHISRDKMMPKIYKYSYRCSDCGQIYNRVRKSIDIKKFVCGKCRGKLVEILTDI